MNNFWILTKEEGGAAYLYLHIFPGAREALISSSCILKLAISDFQQI